jgi:ribonuclease HI
VYGAEAATTNNRMELLAAIEGLRALREPCEVT